MKRYFCTSDIHSFYTPFKNALDESGFDINNKDHILVVLGDIFDRGEETLKVYEFIKSIPQDRRILIRGNHEALYLDLLKKDYPDRYDFHNGTVKTFCAIAGYAEIDMYDFLYDDFMCNKYKKLWKDVKNIVKNHEITTFLKSDAWINYFEINNYIMVHSFIPCRVKNTPENKWYWKMHTFSVDADRLEPVPSWRSRATKKQWYDATWGCPYRQYDAGLFDKEIKRGKTIVVGHWHTSDFFENYHLDFINVNECPIFEGKNYNCKADNLVALDACTALTGRCNVFVIEAE